MEEWHEERIGTTAIDAKHTELYGRRNMRRLLHETGSGRVSDGNELYGLMEGNRDTFAEFEDSAGHEDIESSAKTYGTQTAIEQDRTEMDERTDGGLQTKILTTHRTESVGRVG